jgi:hypothetical protein
MISIPPADATPQRATDLRIALLQIYCTAAVDLVAVPRAG